MEQVRTSPGSPNLERAKIFYRISLGCILFFIAAAILTSQAKQFPLTVVKDFLIGIPAFFTFFSIPASFFYSIKSYTRKEPSIKWKFIYLCGNTFFMFLLLVLVWEIVSDLKKIFG